VGNLLGKLLREWQHAKRATLNKHFINRDGIDSTRKRLSISVRNKRKFSFTLDFGRRGNSEWLVAIKEMLARSVHKIRDAESMETSRASVLKLSFSPATMDSRHNNKFTLEVICGLCTHVAWFSLIELIRTDTKSPPAGKPFLNVTRIYLSFILKISCYPTMLISLLLWLEVYY